MLKKIFVIFKVVVIINLLFCLINKEWTATFICLINFILFLFFDYIKRKLKYKDLLQLFIYIFFISSLLGGEVYFLYTKITYFDLILHTLSSFIISWIVVYIYKLYYITIPKSLLILFIFSFAIMMAGLWEIFEFSVDNIFDRDMQKDTVITEINSVMLSSDGNTVINKKIRSLTIGSYTFNGYLDIGLYDTIWDMICAVFGSLLFIIIYKLKEA